LAGFSWAGGFGLVEDLIDIVPLPKPGAGIRPPAFAVGSQVDGDDVETERAQQRRPGDAADFGIGIAVKDHGATAAGIGGGNPPAGDAKGRAGGLVEDGVGDIFEFHSEIGGGKAMEEDHGAGIGHAARAKKHSGHEEDHYGAEGDADSGHHQGEDHDPVDHDGIINSGSGN